MVLEAIGAAQGLIGAAQSIFGGRRAKRAQRELENLEVPKTTSSAEISDYYNRASANPYDTAMYKMQQQNIARGTAAGLSALQDRRSGLAGISSLVRAQNDSTLRSGVAAEQQQRSLLGNAVRMKAADNERVFQQNKMLPFQKQYSLLSSKAAGGNQMMNAGIQNVFGGLQTAAMGFGNADGGSGADGSQNYSQYSSQGIGRRLPSRIGLTGLNYNSPASIFG